MARTSVTRVIPTAKEPFGPCEFKDGGKAEEDFCKVMSGNKRLNDKCGKCPSPFRLCKQCAKTALRSDPPPKFQTLILNGITR